MKTLHLVIIGAPIAAAILSGVFFYVTTPKPQCIEGRLPNGTCAGPIEINSDYLTNSLGITALIEYAPIIFCGIGDCPPYHFYLKINSNSTAYLLGYNICGDDLCVKKNNLAILLPINDISTPNYTRIGLSENSKWKYGDTANILLKVSPTPDNKTVYVLDIENSTIVP